MKQLKTYSSYAEIKPEYDSNTVLLFTNATWSQEDQPESPAFCVGGFPLPTFNGCILRVRNDDFVFPTQGGYAEVEGRNRYINNCSSSILVMPPKKGDPCVNHLHLIPGVVQTEHHHPSDRFGLVVRGGNASAYYGDDNTELKLRVGVAFHLPAGERHHFETYGDEPTDILVYHPDSDWGPTDESHQMLNATIM